MTVLRYHDGQAVRLGDDVRWGSEGRGTVVVLIAEQKAVPGYNADEWAYLQQGCMIHTTTAGLVHYEAEGLRRDADLLLLARAE